MMEQLIQYFMQETGKKFDDLKSDISEVRVQLDDLKQFKAEMLVSARTTALIVSAICGAVTLTGTVLTIVLFFRK